MELQVHGVVLAARTVSEESRRLSVFTRERGRLFATAPAARRPGARLAAVVEPTVYGRFRLWLPPDGVHGRVTGASLLNGHPRLRGDWRRGVSAVFLCEWIERFTAVLDPHEDLFDLLLSALSGLEQHEPLHVRLSFLVQFMGRAGLGDAAHAARLTGADPAHVSGWAAWDFRETLPMSVAPARLLGMEEQLVQSFAPLLDRPLYSLAQVRAWQHYQTDHTRTEVPR